MNTFLMMYTGVCTVKTFLEGILTIRIDRAHVYILNDSTARILSKIDKYTIMFIQTFSEKLKQVKGHEYCFFKYT